MAAKFESEIKSSSCAKKHTHLTYLTAEKMLKYMHKTSCANMNWVHIFPAKNVSSLSCQNRFSNTHMLPLIIKSFLLFKKVKNKHSHVCTTYNIT